MKYKYEMPRIFDRNRYNGFFSSSYKSTAEGIVREFSNDVVPILKRFDLFNTEFVTKLLTCETYEDIYWEIMCNPVAQFVVKYRQEKEEDFWDSFRAADCDVERPDQDGFKFRDLPYSRYRSAPFVIDALSFKDGQFHIDYDLLKQKCVLQPTEVQRSVYDLAAKFCEDLEKLGYGWKDAADLFTKDAAGRNMPDAVGVIWSRSDPDKGYLI